MNASDEWISKFMNASDEWMNKSWSEMKTQNMDIANHDIPGKAYITTSHPKWSHYFSCVRGSKTYLTVSVDCLLTHC